MLSYPILSYPGGELPDGNTRYQVRYTVGHPTGYPVGYQEAPGYPGSQDLCQAAAERQMELALCKFSGEQANSY